MTTLRVGMAFLVISSLPRILDLAPCARAALLALCLKGGLRTPALGSTDAFHFPSIWKMPVKSKLHTCLKTCVKMYIYIYMFLSTYMYVTAAARLAASVQALSQSAVPWMAPEVLQAGVN